MKAAAKSQVEVYDSRIFYQKVLEVYQSAASEYREMYRLESIRPKDDCVELKVCSPNDEIRILVSLETYFNKGLRKDVLISSDELDELISEEGISELSEADRGERPHAQGNLRLADAEHAAGYQADQRDR